MDDRQTDSVVRELLPQPDETPSFDDSSRGLNEPPAGALDLHRRNADAISIAQHLIVGHRLPIDSNQIVRRVWIRDVFFEELTYRRAFFDVHIVSKACAIIVNAK